MLCSDRKDFRYPNFIAAAKQREMIMELTARQIRNGDGFFTHRVEMSFMLYTAMPSILIHTPHICALERFSLNKTAERAIHMILFKFPARDIDVA